jgi:proteic killer suppression protein
MKTVVEISHQAAKILKKAPQQVQAKFATWTKSVELFGLETVRKNSAYHDEPLQGERKGQRSVRLNQKWRAIYEVFENQVVLVKIMEVTAHDYRRK